jgi:hypothetical protein
MEMAMRTAYAKEGEEAFPALFFFPLKKTQI